MKIVVIGGTGLIGSKTVTILRQRVIRWSQRLPRAESIRSLERASTMP